MKYAYKYNYNNWNIYLFNNIMLINHFNDKFKFISSILNCQH